MKKRITPNTFFVLLNILVIASLIMFFLTFYSGGIWDIATDGFTHTYRSPWFKQPWVWALILMALVMLLFIGTHAGDPNKMETDSEEGTTHV